MKTIYGTLFIALVVSVAFTASYPNPRPAYGYDDIGMEMNPYADTRSLVAEESDFDPSTGLTSDTDADADTEVDTDPSFNYNPIAYSPLSDFIQRMQAMMKKVQSQMGQVLSRMPPQNIDWTKLGNTTSHTKIVNGHVVTVNETTYNNHDADSSSVVRILVQEVRPTDDGIHEEYFSHVPESTYKPKNDQTEDIDADIDHNYRRGSDKFKRQDHRQRGYLDPRFLDSVDNSVDVFEPAQPVDLARDTRVNDLMRDQTKGGLVMIDPNAELIEVQNGQVRRFSPSRRFYDQQRREPIFN